MYNFIVESLQNSYEEMDLISDFESLSNIIYGKLDPSIRHHLQKRGLSIKENVYVGFDTEFTKNDDGFTNTIVSSQLAVTSKVYVQIPRPLEYKISSIDEQSNMLIHQVTNSSNFNYSKIEMSIQICINNIRKIKYGQNDLGMLILTEGLRLIKGLSYYEKVEYTIFSLPRSVVQPYIQYGSSFSMRELIEISCGISKTYLDQSHAVIVQLIKSISSDGFNLLEGKEKMLEKFNKKYEGYRELEEMSQGCQKPQPIIELSDIPLTKVDKRLTRHYLNDLFSQKISVTRIKSYYVIAHLTPADLSLLSDFSEIKEDLNILNGSFVTLGKPLKFKGHNVHIRDTMLLAPGGSKALAAIGSLYDVSYHKIKISQSDLEDMQGFLNRDKESFIEYALRDAVISLIHAA